VVVAAGVTLVLPSAQAIATTPLSMEQDVAPTTPVHASVDDPPGTIVPGLAVNVPIVDGVTVTVAVAVMVPAAPVAVNV
jgi:hypothetical protein